MHERHQAHTLHYRHVYILVFFHAIVRSFSLRCMRKFNALRVGVKTLHNTIHCAIEL